MLSLGPLPRAQPNNPAQTRLLSICNLHFRPYSVWIYSLGTPSSLIFPFSPLWFPFFQHTPTFSHSYAYACGTWPYWYYWNIDQNNTTTYNKRLYLKKILNFCVETFVKNNECWKGKGDIWTQLWELTCANCSQFLYLKSEDKQGTDAIIIMLFQNNHQLNQCPIYMWITTPL